MTAHPRHWRRAMLLATLATLATTGACFRRPAAPSSTASAWREWPAALEATTRYAAAGRHGAADSALASFIARWPGSPESDEGTYWRALLRLDPSNTTTPGDPTAQIDSAMARLAPGPRRDELMILRRIMVSLRALTAEGAALRSAAAEAKPKEDEVAKLKEELARTQAELERVRRRVTRRPP